MHKTIKSFTLIVFLILIILQDRSKAASEKTASPVYNTFEYLLGEFKADIDGLAKKVSNSILLKVSVEGDIDKTFNRHVRRSLESFRIKGKKFRFRQCKACTSLRAETIGNQIYLKKGITEFKDIQEITQKLGTMSYAEASVEDTGTRLIFKVSFFSSLNAELLWSKTYQMRLVSFGDLSFTAALEVKQAFGRNSPLLFNASFGEKIYGIGLIDLNVTLGLASGKDNPEQKKGSSIVLNPNEDYVNSYFAIGPRLTVNINEFFQMYSNWGSQFIYAGTGFCQYTRLKTSTDTEAPTGKWGLHIEAGYGVHLGRTFLITAGLTKGLFLSSDDKDQDYPLLFNIGFGFRF
ncbi:MAG: hypothetical protein VXW15_07740 [Bdellovibrionota bacterium]|nr:hypothetical protein [Bdellovibrionota bacterium]